jgi:transforming growth factor-beta-induced protein
VGKFSKSVKKFAALAGVASTFVTLPVLAQNMPAHNMQTQPQAETKPMPQSAAESSNSTTGNNIFAVADSSKSFHVLTGLLRLTNLDEVLKGGSYTVFAPTDTAFASLPPETFKALLKPENRQTLIEILKYHVVPGDMTSSSLKSGAFKTVEGANVDVSVGSSGVTVGGATVTQPDIKASNGVIHVIDKVIVPSAIATAVTSMLGPNALTPRSFSALTSSSSTTISSRSTSMSTGSGSMTMSPSSTSMSTGSGSMTMSPSSTSMNTGSGSMRMNSGSSSMSTGSNSMRMNSGSTSMSSGSGSSSTTMNSSATTANSNLVAVAASNNSFKILTAALKATGLDQKLASGGPYTIFAPTDEAFDALPEGVVEELLKPENRDTLIKILTYHVVQGEKSSSMLQSGETETLEGASVQVNVSSSGVMVNDAKVVQPDIQASNGIIHVIDKVILPPRP